MFIIRQANVEDQATLLKLAKMVHFINLPADPDIISQKIARSRASFSGKVKSAREREYMFVMEDTETGNVIGTSSVICCNSWPGKPHTFLQVRKRELYSEDLKTGQVHITLQLGTDESGPSEIGGLILGPSYRGHKQKLGAQLSMVRFHFIGLHRKSFAERIIAEMMGALTPDSRNLLWEYLGRRFINLTYPEADRFCQHSKEFITSLFPKEEIYVSLLPPEARNLIGNVGNETRGALGMLERLGFAYKGQVDPFDGGPYLEAAVAEIPLVKATKKMKLAGTTGPMTSEAFVSHRGEHGFRAVRTACGISADSVTVPEEVAATLGAKQGDSIGFTPIEPAAAGEKRRSSRNAGAGGSAAQVEAA